LRDLKKITGIDRQQYNLKRLQLTKFKLNIPPRARVSTVEKAFYKEKISRRFADSNWGKRLNARENRQALSDFGRFKVMLAQKKLKNELRSHFLRDAADKKRRRATRIATIKKRREDKGIVPTPKTPEEIAKIKAEKIATRKAKKDLKWKQNKEAAKKKPKKVKPPKEEKKKVDAKSSDKSKEKKKKSPKRKIVKRTGPTPGQKHKKLFDELKARTEANKKRKLEKKANKPKSEEKPKSVEKPKEAKKPKKKVRISTEAPASQ